MNTAADGSRLVWYGGRLFRSAKSSSGSQTSGDTIFKYEQQGRRVSATYSGGDIEFGHLLGLVAPNGHLAFRYHHIDISGEIRSGRCETRPEFLDGGKLRLHERWEWDDGGGHGISTLEEI